MHRFHLKHDQEVNKPFVFWFGWVFFNYAQRYKKLVLTWHCYNKWWIISKKISHPKSEEEMVTNHNFAVEETG